MKLLDWLKSRWYIFLLTDTPEWRCREVYYDEHGNWFGDIQAPMNPADPQHYKTKSMECREVIKVMTEGLNGADAYYMGNVLKYLYRYADKNGTEDLDKAITYISFLKGE